MEKILRKPTELSPHEVEADPGGMGPHEGIQWKKGENSGEHNVMKRENCRGKFVAHTPRPVPLKKSWTAVCGDATEVIQRGGGGQWQTKKREKTTLQGPKKTQSPRQKRLFLNAGDRQKHLKKK